MVTITPAMANGSGYSAIWFPCHRTDARLPAVGGGMAALRLKPDIQAGIAFAGKQTLPVIALDVAVTPRQTLGQFSRAATLLDF